MSMLAMGLYGSNDSFSGDDRKVFNTFKGCIEARAALVGKGSAERRLNQLFMFNSVGIQLSGSVRDSDLAARARVLSM